MFNYSEKSSNRANIIKSSLIDKFGNGPGSNGFCLTLPCPKPAKLVPYLSIFTLQFLEEKPKSASIRHFKTCTVPSPPHS